MSDGVIIRDARHWRTGRPIDMAFAGGVVVATPPPGARVIDAGGAVIAPGLVDAHVHLREPGQSGKETIATGTRAAAAGGFTDVVCMPNTVPVLDSVAGIEWVLARARAAGHARVHPVAAATAGQQGEQLAELVTLARGGAVAFSDDGRPIMSAGMMRRVLDYARPTGRPVIAHEEDLHLKAEGQMNEGATATRLGLRGIPSAAESVMVRRDVELAALTRGRLHLAHLSCAESLDALRDAKRRGLDVTGETCPHYWALTDEAVDRYGTSAKMNPPLRSETDRLAVIEAIQDGTIDCLVTDHAPHTAEEKGATFDEAPMGIVGLETALALTLTLLARPGHISLPRAIQLWTEAPRHRFGLPPVTLEPGSPADFVLFDPDAEWTVDPERFYSKGRNTPFRGWTLHGRVLLTVCAGHVTHDSWASDSRETGADRPHMSERGAGPRPEGRSSEPREAGAVVPHQIERSEGPRPEGRSSEPREAGAEAVRDERGGAMDGGAERAARSVVGLRSAPARDPAPIRDTPEPERR